MLKHMKSECENGPNSREVLACRWDGVVPWPFQGRWTCICSSFSTLHHSFFLIQRTQWEELKISVFSCWVLRGLAIARDQGWEPSPSPLLWMPDSDSLWRRQVPEEVACCRLRVELIVTGHKPSEHTVFPSRPTETNAEFHFYHTSHQDHQES